MYKLAPSFAAVLAMAVPSFAQAVATDATTIASQPTGKTYFWLGVWPDYIVQFDPETDTITKRVKLKNGIQFGIQLSHDKSHFMVITGQQSKVEVVSLNPAEVVDVHEFTEPEHIIRVRSVREIPGGTHWYVNIDRIEIALDHFNIKRPEWLRYNVATKEIEERMEELPEAIRSGAFISPDGKKWHVIRDDITVIDPITLEEEGVIDLTTPLYTGLGAIRVTGDDFYHRQDPDRYKMLYTMTDPVNDERTLFGVVDINMKEMKVDGITEWGASPGYRSFHMSKDRKVAVASRSDGGQGYERGVKLAYFDLETGRKLREAIEQFPPRRGLRAISPDGSKLYIGGAGNHFSVFNDQLEKIKEVEFDGDLHGFLFVVDG